MPKREEDMERVREVLPRRREGMEGREEREERSVDICT